MDNTPTYFFHQIKPAKLTLAFSKVKHSLTILSEETGKMILKEKFYPTDISYYEFMAIVENFEHSIFSVTEFN